MMDNSALYQLYNGRLYPAERGTAHIDEYEQISYKMTREVNILKDRLSEKDYEQIMLLESLDSELNHLEKFDLFCYVMDFDWQLNFSQRAYPLFQKRGNL